MYDSDEVRDKVRREMAELDARTEASRQFVEGMRELVEKLAQQFYEAFRPLMENVAETLNKFGMVLAEVNELLWPADEGDGFSWRRRPRRPEVRPVRGVDAVAAGRSPGMIVRTRIRGGRR